MNESSMSNVRILLVGGGTGGHFYPLISIAESLRDQAPGIRLYYAGPDTYDAPALAELNIDFIQIPAGKQRRYASFLNIIDMGKVVYGCFVAFVKLYVLYPDVIVSKGGYTSVPVVLAAAFFRIPILIHESDSVLGRANKIAIRFAREVIVNYPELKSSLKHPRVEALGIPIRKVLRSRPSTDAIQKLGIDPERPVILIIGGSQGAERINELILDTLDELLTTYTVIHQTGNAHFEICKLSAEKLIPDDSIRKHYHPFPFLESALLNDAYHLASLVISRAGSTSIYEIALHGKPSIIIPIPESISHDQRTNAYAYARVSGATVLEEGNWADGLLKAEIDRIMGDTTLYARLEAGARSFGREDTADHISTRVLERAIQH